MKKQIRCLLLALCGLTAHGAPAEEIPTPRKSVRQEDQAPVRAAEDVPPADTRLWNLDRKPYGDWVFKPEPYLVTMEAYGDLFSKKEVVYDENGTPGYWRPDPVSGDSSLDYTQHTIGKPLEITLEVLSGYPGETPDIYISEIGVGIDSNLPQGL